MKVVANIQARMTSSRLPGKMLRDVIGKPLIQHQIERIWNSGAVDDIVLAIPRSPANDGLERIGNALDCKVYRGSEEDCLGRNYEAAKRVSADIVFLLGADDVLIDTGLMRLVKERLIYSDDVWVWAYGWPVGTNPGAVRFPTLEQAAHEANGVDEREHIATFWHRRLDRFPLGLVKRPGEDLTWKHRLTVDFPEDLELHRKILTYYGRRYGFDVGIEETIGLLRAHPEWEEGVRNLPQYVPNVEPVQ